jgi:hypothetical protein
MRRVKGIVRTICLCASTFVSVQAATQPNEQVSCREVATNVVALNKEAILKRAVKRVEPEIPGGFGRIDGRIEVFVLVGTDGKVVCAEALEPSHPILRRYCEDAARKWEFRTLRKAKLLVQFKGVISFRLRR